MEQRPKSPDTFARTRKDHATEVAEDYVEAVGDVIAEKGQCRVTDLAQVFGVSHVTVIRVVKRLERDGFLVTAQKQPLTLTPEGQRLADHCRNRHDIVYRFLITIGVDAKAATFDSEGMEHHLSAETLERFKQIADSGKL